MTHHAITPRSPGVDLDAPLPRLWFGDNVFATHLVNGLNLLFPAGERFFVRSVKHYLDRVDDESLRAQIKGFFGQEGRHAKEHERVFERLEEQGFAVRPFLRAYEWFAYGVVERVSPPAIRLAATAACEHYTALLAEQALARDLLDLAHPTMRALLKWHAAEEIEHRAVAYDVLARVDPRYRTRVAGFAIASIMRGGFWLLGFATLIAQDEARARLAADSRAARNRPRAKRFARGIRDYLRRDFHPSQRPLDALAAGYLQQAGLA